MEIPGLEREVSDEQSGGTGRAVVSAVAAVIVVVALALTLRRGSAPAARTVAPSHGYVSKIRELQPNPNPNREKELLSENGKKAFLSMMY